MTLSRRSAILTGAALASLAQPAFAQGFDRRAVARRLADVVRREYQDAVAAERLGDAIEARLRKGAYDNAPDEQSLSAVLTEDLRATVSDRHMAVMWNIAEADAELSLDPVFSLRQNYGVQAVRRLGGNIGLIDLNFAPSLTMGEPLLERYAGAMALVRDTRALIVDVRAHIGGEPDTVAYFASYFFDRAPFVINRIRYRNRPTVDFRTTDAPKGGKYGEKRPVFVLVSGDTFSGGEELAYDLQAVGRARIVGKPTGGGANPNAAYDLGQGFTAFVPNGAAQNPFTGTNWEGVGVKPDVDVDPSKSLDAAHRLALQAALALATTADERESINSAIESLPN